MLNSKREHIFTFIKVALVSLSAAFFISSCAIVSSFTHSDKSTPPRILSSHQTHALLAKWSASNYQSLPGHTITYSSHHPLVKKFTEIKSGYSISPLTNRTKGIGLASVIKKSTPASSGNNFTPITSDAYLTNLHPANIVATQTRINGKLSTNIDIYDPRSSKHQQKALAYQPKIVMDYLNEIPGNSTLDIMGLIRPQKYNTFQGFYLAEPYDRNRIPVLMIHGLVSSPEAFMDMSEAINTDPNLRKKYQLWYYFYPSGTPWIASSSKFRKSYRKLIQKLDPNKNDTNIRKTVLIAHSMGGLISRLALSHPGKSLHQAYLGNISPTSVFTEPEQQRIHDYFHFKPLTEPAKIIYLATPHRGSKIADGVIGWVAIKIITIPTFILKQTAGALTPSQRERPRIPKRAQKLLSAGQSSVDQLKPANPSLSALNQMKMRKGLISYSIIGDIGKPLFNLKTDGVVSYHSAHIPFSKSESVIPSAHNICGQPEAIQAVLKILNE
ncbi:MAG: pimeloyl-ACP methyl ester carboxylesterase [Cryomorphaceae bacterium]|jgi:pimeloyl-ACP methyl ester carboxylesterase